MKRRYLLVFLVAATLFVIGVSCWPRQPAQPSAVQGASPAVATAVAISRTLPKADALSPDSATGPAEVARVPDFARILAFNDWAQHWQAADAVMRQSMVAEGLQLAQARRPAYKALIASDPRRALERAVPRVVLQDLPPAIVAQLERPISATGDLNVYRGLPRGAVEPGTELTLRYFETTAGESLKARVFGEMTEFNSKQAVALRGVAIDREFAVAPNPVRQLEPGERIPPSARVESLCPVSGNITPIVPPGTPVMAETPTVELGERFITLCDGSHVKVLEDQQHALLQASGPGGAGFMKDAFPGTSAAAIGNFRTLYIRVTYPDQLKAPNTEDAAYGDMRNVSRFYLENSYGRMTTTSTVTPLLVLPHSQAWYIAKDSEVDGLGLVHSDARAAAKKLGYDNSQFTCTIVRVNGGPRLSGISWGGGSSVWVSWDGMDVLNHECGHSLGRNHANYWDTTDNTAYGAGSNQEYGNPFDVMGGGGGFGAHYNTKNKRDLGWLSEPYLHRPAATQNGIYRLHAYDQPQLEEGKRYAFRVVKDSIRTYYIEYHPASSSFTDSALVLYSWSGMTNAGLLLDTTPGSPGGKNDGGIQIGQTYSDLESDQHFTVLGKNPGTPPSLDLAYMRGPFTGNRPPSISLTSSATAIAVGGSIAFTATATDPDGDVLAYHWAFSDGVVSTNTPTFTRTFPTTDQMTVMVTASDLKGGTARSHAVVTVGSPGRGVVTGVITHDSKPLAGVLLTSDTNKFCYSDSNGNYALSDLQTGARTITAQLAGHALTADFTNPLTVTTGTNTGNWTATASQLVTLTKTADATEGGAGGSFTLTRTGDLTSALDVQIAPIAGTATITTDYAFSPAYLDDGSFRKFTIPAGESTLEISVSAVDDAGAEGPETIAMQLAANGSSITTSPGLAVLTLHDNDTTLPLVSLTTTEPYANEAGGSGTITLTRSGDPGSALNVTLTYSGNATRGSDFTAPGMVTIPATKSSLDVGIIPLNDTTIEGPEDATVTLASSAGYLRDPAAQTATVNLTDDDTPIVSVTAIDPDASEANRDPGVILVSRTGSTAATLIVYYGLSGRALHGTDYAALTGQVTLPAGAASAPVMITPYDDDLGEPTESVTLNLTTFGNAYSLDPGFTATVNITDNADAPVVSVRASASPTEPGTAGSFIIRAIGSAPGEITVNYALSGTATSGSDYTTPGSSVTLPASGSNETTVTIPILDDELPEDTETIIMTLTAGPGYRVYNDGSATLRLKDNDSGERVMISTWNATPKETGAVAGKFYLSRAGTTGDLDVAYQISGTATNGVDYTALSGSATIPDGASGADVVITPVDDTAVEGSETITLTIIPGPGYGPEMPASATLYLTDSETPVSTVGFESATGTTTEALPAGTEFRDIPVTLSPASSETVTVEFTSGGGSAQGDDVDWTFVDAAAGNAVISGGVLTFAPGVTNQMVRIRVRNDTVIEGNETAILTLQNARLARISTSRTSHTLTISDANDPTPRVRMLIANSVRAESAGSEPLLMAVLDCAQITPVTVQYTVSGTASPGSDFTLAPGTLTFAAGETMKLLPLVILADEVVEPLETLEITLTNSTGAELSTPVTHIITLRDAVTPEVTLTATASELGEQDGPANFTVAFTSPATFAFPLAVHYAVSGTAVADSDYAMPSGTVIIPAGASSVSLPIVLMNDTTSEPDETLNVMLVADAAYDLGQVSQATTTLLDDDALPTVTILSPVRSTAVIPAGVGLMVNAAATRETPQGMVNLPVSWDTVSGPGTVTWETVTATSSAATFASAGSYVLRASTTYGTTTVTDEVRVEIGTVLTAQTIGSTTAAGSWSEVDSEPGSHAGGTLTVGGAGSGISGSGTSDGFYYLATPVTGDFDLKVRLVGIANPAAGGSCRIGLMARASTATNAPYAYSLHKGTGEHGFQARLTAGAAPYTSTGSTKYTMPRWLRLVRSGDLFTAYQSADGSTWSQRGTAQTIATMGASPLVGLAITSAVAATPATAVFDNLNFLLPTNFGPAVHAGAALTGSGPWFLDATATDDNRPAALSLLWTAASGPGTTTFATPAAIDTGVTFSESGTYRLRLTASDGAITTFAASTANISVAGPLLAWRQLHFGTTSSTGNSANATDADHDGLTNMIEYALVSPPTNSNGSPMTITQPPGAVVIAVARDPSRTDASVTIEAATTLEGPWTPVARSSNGSAFAPLVPEVSVSETGSSPVTAAISLPVLPTSSVRFFRAKVELATP